MCTIFQPWTSGSSEWKERAGGGICMQSRIMTRQDYRAQEFIELILKPRGGRVRAAATAAWNQFPDCVFNQNSGRHSSLGGILSRLWSCCCCCYEKRLFGNEPEYIWVCADYCGVCSFFPPRRRRRAELCAVSHLPVCLFINNCIAHIFICTSEKRRQRKETKKRGDLFSPA